MHGATRRGGKTTHLPRGLKTRRETRNFTLRAESTRAESTRAESTRAESTRGHYRRDNAVQQVFIRILVNDINVFAGHTFQSSPSIM